MSDSFWVIPDGARVKTPIAILLEQANALKDKTGGKLIARVDRGGGPAQIVLDLVIMAPALNNFTFNVVRLVHGIALYPVQIHFGVKNYNAIATDETQLINNLKNILGSPEIQKVIVGLLSQVDPPP